MPDRFHNSERYADQIGKDRSDQAVIERYGQTVRDHAQDRFVVTEGLPEIESHGFHQPFAVSLEQRLIEAVEFAKLLQLVVGDFELRARAAARATLARRTCHLQPELIDRPPGHELAEQKRDEGDPDEGRYHQQQPPHHIIAQGFAA
jgi:hypothetical protein